MGKIIDETGNEYGYLTVLNPIKIKNKIYWNCKCKCGKEIFVIGADLRRGHTTSCGCKIYRGLNLTNKRFGRLVVLECTNKRKHNNVIWRCKCDCGNECEVQTSSLLQGFTQSCGCLHKEIASNVNKKSLINKNLDY